MYHKIVALVSGGKDSTFTIIKCIQEGHDIVALANLQPPAKIEELDSFMYQSVGHNAISYVAKAIGVKLFQSKITGTALLQELKYNKTKNDEVEDLYELLKEIKDKTGCTAVCSGAIFSTYQKNRVEEVCKRLCLVSITPLWENEQTSLLREMIDNHLMIRIIKVASIGLDKSHVGSFAHDLIPHFETIKNKFGFNVCGEGGEYESLVTDCPLYSHKLEIKSSEKICHSYDDMSPVWFEKINEIVLIEKPGMDKLSLKDRLYLCLKTTS